MAEFFEPDIRFWDPNYIRPYVTAGDVYDSLGLGWSISEETRKQIIWENPKFKDGAILIDYCIDPIDCIRIRINDRFEELERKINEVEF